MKTQIILLSLLILLIGGCITSLTTKEEKKMPREVAEQKALEFIYEATKNKEVFDQPVTIQNYVFDSWKEEDIWHVIIYVGHTFIEVWVYDDGSGDIKVLTKTDYWKKVPKTVKDEINQKTNKNII